MSEDLSTLELCLILDKQILEEKSIEKVAAAL